jgi:hypothetical protein
MKREDIYWTVIRVTYGDGSVVENNETNIALINAYTGEGRGGEVKREYIERVDPDGACGTSRWKGVGTPVERLEVIARDIRQRIEDSTSPVSLDFVLGRLLEVVTPLVDPSVMMIGTHSVKYKDSLLCEVVAYMNWRGI